MKNFTDILAIVAVVGGVVAAVASYAKALSEVKMGQLIVYKDWGDFLRASAWIVIGPFGAFYAFGGENIPSRVLGAISLVAGIISFWWTCAGAFRYNCGSRRGLALFARFAVTLLCFFAIGEVSEKFGKYKRGELGVVRGVLIPVLIFAWVFRELIRPMIGLQYYHAWRLMRE